MRHPLLGLLLVAPLAAQAKVDDKILNATFAPTAAEIFGHAAFLAHPSLKGRAAGTEQEAIAAAYVAAEFRKLGLAAPEGFADYEQPFDIAVPVQVDGKVQAEKRKSRNVVAWLAGSDDARKEEFVLVGAHYDHVGMRGGTLHPGADDNASGTAALLAIARALATGATPPRRSILFVAFGAEEIGLVGSEHFARHPVRSLQQCVAMINIDMLGRGRFLDLKGLAVAKMAIGVKRGPGLGVLGLDTTPEWKPLLQAITKADKLPVYAPDDFPLIGEQFKAMADGRSDHAAFERRKIPFLFFSTSMHDDYHQPTDTLDKLDPQAMRRYAQAVYRMVLAIDANDERARFVEAGAK